MWHALILPLLRDVRILSHRSTLAILLSGSCASIQRPTIRSIIPDCNSQGLLLPEEDVHITLCVLVTEETASRFNLGPYRLEHTLILHVARGKDHFVALGADYGTRFSAEPRQEE